MLPFDEHFHLQISRRQQSQRQVGVTCSCHGNRLISERETARPPREEDSSPTPTPHPTHHGTPHQGAWGPAVMASGTLRLLVLSVEGKQCSSPRTLYEITVYFMQL